MRFNLRAALVAALAATSLATAVPIMPLDQVKEGAKGYGLTVWQGTKIERFECTVVGVLKSFDFQMDMILIHVDSGPVVDKKYGIVAGMSGSPIYVDDKLIGALAYGWEFQSEPIAGVTPIEQMLAQYDPKHPAARAAAARRAASRLASNDDPLRQDGSLLPAGGSLSVGQRVVSEVRVAPNRQAARDVQTIRPDVGVMTPVATPLLVSGLPASAMPVLGKVLAPYNLIPMQAGAARAAADTPVDFSPGAAAGVVIASGDIEMTAIGTLTYREGDTVMCFGHPFMALGGVDMPLTSAYITTVIASLNSSNKMGGPIAAIGRISQDRPTCIGGRLGASPELLPVRYHITEAARGVDTDFRVKVIRQNQLSEYLCAMLLQSSLQNAAGRMFDGVTNTRVEIDCREGKDGAPFKVVRSGSVDSKSGGGRGGPMGGGYNPLADLYMTLSMLKQNPFGDVNVRSVTVDLALEADRRLASIQRAQARKQVVKPGETVEVTAWVKPYGGQLKPMSVKFAVPEDVPLGPLAAVLMGGSESSQLRPMLNPEPRPHDVASLVAWLNNPVRNDCLLLELVQSTQGAEFGGRKLPELPDHVVMALASTRAESLAGRMDVTERVVPTDTIITGAAVVILEVVGEDGRRAAKGDREPSGPGLEEPSMGPAGRGGLGPMDGFEAAARGRAQAFFGTDVLSELAGWSLAPSDNTAAAHHLRQLWDDAWRVSRLGQRRPVALAAASKPDKAQPAKPDKGQPEPDKAKPEPGKDKPDAGKDGPPDVTDSLNLKKPPRLPGYDELDDVAHGKLGNETDAEADTPDKLTTEDEDGSALARPLKSWVLGSAEEFAKGRFEGTFGDSSGTVSLAPTPKTVGRPEVERLWSVLARPDGSVIAGSWSVKAKLYRLAADGQVSTLFESPDDVGLTALCALDDQTIVVGGVPSGRLYKLGADGQAKLFATLPATYVWALAADGHGGVYAGTGPTGKLFAVSATGEVKLLLQTGDRHVTALATSDGALLAATCPDGLVYRLKDGALSTVYQAEDAGILSLARTANGRLYCGTNAGKVVYVEADGHAKEVFNEEGATVYALTALGNQVFGALSTPGRVLRLDEQDDSAMVYRSEEPLALGLGSNAKDELYAAIAASGDLVKLALGSGERGTYTSEVHDCEMVSRWGLLRWSQTLSGKAVIGLQTRSGNTAVPDKGWSAWSDETTAVSGAKVTSPPARYLQWRAKFYGAPGDTSRLDRVELLYRPVNRAPVVKFKEPEAGAALRAEAKLKWEAEDPDDDDLTYEVYYAPLGTDKWTKIEGVKKSDKKGGDADTGDEPDPDEDAAAPDKDTKAGPKAAPKVPVNGKPTPAGANEVATWPRPLATKPTSERRGGSHGPLADAPRPRGKSHSEKKASKESGDGAMTSSDLTWDTTKVPDGLYVLKVVASDAKRNPDDPRTAEVRSKPVRLDNTPPYALFELPTEAQPLPATVRFGEDGTWLTSAEYRFDDGEWTAWLPVGGLFGERFAEFAVPKAPTDGGDHTLSMRVRDAAENIKKLQWKFHVDGPAKDKGADKDKPAAAGKPDDTKPKPKSKPAKP